MTDFVFNSKTIFRNTIMLYVRMLFNLVVSFFTYRVLLDNLGLVDFGISNVVGGVVMLFSFINNSMALSVQRFLSYEFGKKDGSSFRLNTIYSMSLLIHLIIAVLVILGTEILGTFLLPELNIPLERKIAAEYVFHISVISCAIGFMQIPPTALIMATERMSIYAYVGILDILLKLLIVYLLPILPYDSLISYSYLLLFSTILITTVYYFYCYKMINYVRFMIVWNGAVFREMLSFASWSLMGEMAWTAVGQGVNIVINLFFSPVVNAARAVSLQVSVKLKEFVMNFQTAMNPQIIKLYASEDEERMFRVSSVGTKFSYFLMLFISMPFLFDIDWVLSFWLKEVPEWTSIFCRLTIIGTLTDILSNLFSTIVKATGRIKKYQIIVSFVLFLNLPFSYVVLYIGFPPSSVFVIYILVSFLLLVVRFFLVKRLVPFRISDYIKKVLFPSFTTTLVAIPVPLLVYNNIQEPSFVRFIILSFVCLFSTGLSILICGINDNERTLIKNKLKSYVK